MQLARREKVRERYKRNLKLIKIYLQKEELTIGDKKQLDELRRKTELMRKYLYNK